MSEAEDLSEQEESVIDEDCTFCNNDATQLCEACDEPICDDCCVDGLCPNCY